MMKEKSHGNSEPDEPATGLCKGCLEPIPEPTYVRAAGIKIHKRWCDGCIEERERREAEAARLKRRIQRENRYTAIWEAICDPTYRESDPDKTRMGAAMFRAIINHDWIDGSVLIVGETGQGKTRAAYQLVRREIWLGKKVRAATPAKFRAGLSASRRDGHDRYLEELIACDVLLLDDLGQIAGTPAATEAIHDLVERRTACDRPTIITTQADAKKLAARFESLDAGRAICRRIAEFFNKYQA